MVLPTSPGEPPLIAFPLTPLPMGSVESPPYFTVLTETACDLANSRLRQKAASDTPHWLEAIAATPQTDDPTAADTARRAERTRSGGQLRLLKRGSAGQPPVAAVDVYVDDFLLMAQMVPQQKREMRATLEAIDHVFQPLAPHDPSHRKELASVKKMLKGDACWATTKRILGWDLDTVAETINLQPHGLEMYGTWPPTSAPSLTP